MQYLLIFQIVVFVIQMDGNLYAFKSKSNNSRTKIRYPNRKYDRPYGSLGLSYYKRLKFNNSLCEIDTCTVPIREYKYRYISQVSPASKEILIKSCGPRQVFLSNSVKNGADAWKFCCKLGMVPLTLDDRKHLECLNAAVMKVPELRNINDKMGFTTGYSDHTSKRDFVACPSKTWIPEDSWSPKQPDNMLGVQGCVSLAIAGSRSSIGFNDQSCIDPMLAGCERDPSVSVLASQEDPFKTAVTSTSIKLRRQTLGILDSLGIFDDDMEEDTSTVTLPSSLTVQRENLNISKENVTVVTALKPIINDFISFKKLEYENMTCFKEIHINDILQKLKELQNNFYKLYTSKEASYLNVVENKTMTSEIEE